MGETKGLRRAHPGVPAGVRERARRVPADKNLAVPQHEDADTERGVRRKLQRRSNGENTAHNHRRHTTKRGRAGAALPRGHRGRASVARRGVGAWPRGGHVHGQTLDSYELVRPNGVHARRQFPRRELYADETAQPRRPDPRKKPRAPREPARGGRGPLGRAAGAEFAAADAVGGAPPGGGARNRDAGTENHGRGVLLVGSGEAVRQTDHRTVERRARA
mmetsp:Transcript_19714/g.49496  ORF Transcript_19714/g.49496 Transcript_19714/m.49496 type:complete len:219 (+) Transcript_19714:1480-2136(+)